MGAGSSAHDQPAASAGAPAADEGDQRAIDQSAIRPGPGAAIETARLLNELEERPVEEAGYGHGV